MHSDRRRYIRTHRGEHDHTCVYYLYLISRYKPEVTHLVKEPQGHFQNLFISQRHSPLNAMSRSVARCLRLLGWCVLIGASTAQNITADSFFYGQSPPVYPTRKQVGQSVLQMLIILVYSPRNWYWRLVSCVFQSCCLCITAINRREGEFSRVLE